MNRLTWLVLIILFLFAQSALAICVDGTTADCVVNGKHGTRDCMRGKWGVCEIDSVTTVNGTVLPSYYILDVFYAPPGTTGGQNLGSVSYTSGSSIGSTVGSTNTFKSDTSVSVKATGGGGSVGAEFDFSASTAAEGAIDFKKTVSQTFEITAAPADGIDHERDAILIWLKPSLDVTITQPNVSWTFSNGQTIDQQYVYMSWLKTPASMPQGVRAQLDAAGITEAQYPDILKVNPFSGGGNAIDPQRFVSVGYTLPYEPPQFASSAPISTTFTISFDTSKSAKSSLQTDVTVGVSVGASGDFPGIFKSELNTADKWTWTNVSTSGTTDGRTQTATAKITGPSYGYVGSTSVSVYYDVLYKTFMFALVDPSLKSLSGSLKSRSGEPVGGQKIVATVGNHKYVTFSNSKGQFAFGDRLNGAVELQVGGTKQKVASAMRRQELSIELP